MVELSGGTHNFCKEIQVKDKQSEDLLSGIQNKVFTSERNGLFVIFTARDVLERCPRRS